MIEPGGRELRRLTLLAIDLDAAIIDYRKASQAEAAAAYAQTGRPFAPEAEGWRRKIRAIFEQRRALAAVMFR